MAATKFLHSFLEVNCPFVHAARRRPLIRTVAALVGGAKLNLSALGRALPGRGKTKHKIKLVDRLLGNRHLDAERTAIYTASARWALAGLKRPVIAVDWSDLETGNHTQLLKAAVTVRGRALTVYDEVHPVKGFKRARAERAFLDTLATVVPAGCRPVIVTDAGFHAPWFAKVLSLGWDYLGRVRGTVHHRSCATLDDKADWRPVTALHALASRTATCLGHVVLSRGSRFVTRLCLYRDHKPRPGRRPGDKPRHPKYREPWVLATNLNVNDVPPAQVVAVYRKRMQIEETFRDMKAARWGFALEFARSRSLARRANLALIAALALFVLWLLGLAGRALGWERDFQANTVRQRTVLSDVFLGRELHRFRERYALDHSMLETAARLLRLNIQELDSCLAA